MKETHIHTIPLANGQTVEIWDASRKLAADRWQVTLVARMEIPVDAAIPPSEASAVKQALGDTVMFETKKQRHFIDETKKQGVLADMLETFTRVSVPYLSHPDFAARHVARRFAEHRKRRSWGGPPGTQSLS